MPAKKTAKKTAKKKTAKRKATRGRPFAKGADSRRGVGKKGRSGRIANELKAECRDAIFSFGLRKVINYVKAPKKTASDAGFRWALDTLLERGFGKVPQPVTGDSEGDPIAIKVERAKALKSRLMERLARIEARDAKK